VVPRRAQRAIRQRTKDHIESLTRRIEELTQTSDLNARLNQALQRNEELVQENKSIRDKLNSIVKAVTEGQRE
jgi:regulator of replication initiation timing